MTTIVTYWFTIFSDFYEGIFRSNKESKIFLSTTWAAILAIYCTAITLLLAAVSSYGFFCLLISAAGLQGNVSNAWYLIAYIGIIFYANRKVFIDNYFRDGAFVKYLPPRKTLSKYKKTIFIFLFVILLLTSWYAVLFGILPVVFGYRASFFSIELP